MKIAHFFYIVKVAETKSLSKAAESLFVSKQNLSDAIIAAEEELGFTIFVRSSKGMELTAEGEVAVHISKEIIQAFDQLRAINKASPTTIRMGWCCHLASIYIPQLMDTFKNAFPQLELVLSEYPINSQCIQDLYDQKLDLCILTNSPWNTNLLPSAYQHNQEAFQQITLLTDELRLLAHQDLQVQKWTDALSANLLLVSMRDRTSTRCSTPTICHSMFFPNHEIRYVYSQETYRAMINSGLAIGLSTKYLLQYQPWHYSEQICIIAHGEKNTTLDIQLYLRKSVLATPSIQELIAQIQTIFV